MRPKTPDLAALRRQIDKLDEQIHDAVMERARALSQIVAVKNREPGGFIRPGREAQILRRLLGRHSGPLPAAALARIWRELISSLYGLQGSLQVAVYAPGQSMAERTAFWDLARGQFGATTPMAWHGSAQSVLHAVIEHPGTLGILPLPQEGEAGPWWPHLALRAPAGAPKQVGRVIGRLPFVRTAGHQGENAGALVVGEIAPEASGDDVSLLALTAPSDSISRARIVDLLGQCDLKARALAAVDGQKYLFEIEGFVEANDPRLQSLASASAGTILDPVCIGAYPRPIEATRP